jgi:hypothetical protein
MNSRLEEVLYLLLWSADMVMQPTFRNMTGSFEDWAFRNGLGAQVMKLQRRKLVDTALVRPDGLKLKFTETGRMQALGGRDPVACWSRPWDGWWRLAMFDVPVDQRAKRLQLTRWLRSRGYGCLQGSVWVTPDLKDEVALKEETASHVQSLVFMKGIEGDLVDLPDTGVSRQACATRFAARPLTSSLFEECAPVSLQLSTGSHPLVRSQA